MNPALLERTVALAYPAAAAAEALLGDADDPANPTGLACAVRRDGLGAANTALTELAHAERLQLSYVPAQLGGELVTFEQTLARVRMFARRDAAVMPATMFSVTALTCLLVHGSPEQQRRAVAVLEAGGSVAYALSEPDSGSDLLSLSAHLTPAPGGWLLNGVKWLVGQGAGSELVYVVARTAPRGPVAFSSVLLDGAALADGTVIDSQRSAGLTGVGLDTLRFDAQPVRELVGAVGQGLEAALKSMQVVRLLSTAASLGCADVALRATLRFLTDHRVGGTRCLDWAPARRELATAAGWLIAMDAMSVSASRMLHVRPAAFTLPSAVVKRIATEAAGRILQACADLQASRSVLTGHPHGLLAKLRRDVDTVRYIDTSPAATLRLLASQLPALSAAPGRRPAQAVLDASASTFTLGAELAPYRPDRLDLATRDDDALSAVQLLAEPVAELLALSSDPLAVRASALAHRLRSRLLALSDRVRAGSLTPSRDGGLRALDDAAELATLYAAACCLQLWWFNRDQAVWGQPPGSLQWLVPALAVLVDGPAADVADLDPAITLLSDLDERALLFSVVPVPLAQSGGDR